MLNEVSEISDNVSITGDFNYKEINWEDHTTIHSKIHPEYKFIECLRDNYLFQHVRHFTRCRTEQTRNTLELIISKSEHNIDSIEVGPSLGCIDHVTLIFDCICECKVTYNGNERCLYRIIVNEYDQEIPQSQTADNPVAPRGRAAQPSRDTRKTN